MIDSGRTVTSEEFRSIFANREPFIIEEISDFTGQLRHLSEKGGVPVVHLTPEIIKKVKQGDGNDANISITAESSAYKKSFEKVCDSYKKIATGICRLANLS